MEGTDSSTIYHPSLVLLARYWESSSGSISATHIRPASGRERWRRLHTSVLPLLLVWRRPCPKISCRSRKLIEDGLREMCRPACDINLGKNKADSQACAPSTVSPNCLMRNMFLPCSIEHCAIDLVNSGSPDCRKT